MESNFGFVVELLRITSNFRSVDEMGEAGVLAVKLAAVAGLALISGCSERRILIGPAKGKASCSTSDRWVLAMGSGVKESCHRAVRVQSLPVLNPSGSLWTFARFFLLAPRLFPRMPLWAGAEPGWLRTAPPCDSAAPMLLQSLLTQQFPDETGFSLSARGLLSLCFCLPTPLSSSLYSSSPSSPSPSSSSTSCSSIPRFLTASLHSSLWNKRRKPYKDALISHLGRLLFFSVPSFYCMFSSTYSPPPPFCP